MRFFINGYEKKWLGTLGNFSDEQTVSFDEQYDVKAGDVIIFAVNPEGNDSYDGGRLSVTIKDVTSTDGYDEVEPDPNRTNDTMCDWDSQNFEKLPYDPDNNRYFNSGKPELKADFVEPGNGRNAAYKWIVAKDGTINVKGDYTKFANSDDSNADGTSVRIFINGYEKKWLGTIGNFSDEQTVSFDEQYDVKAGDVIIFAVNPEGNDSYDGGRLSVTIKDVTAADSDAVTGKDPKDATAAEDPAATSTEAAPTAETAETGSTDVNAADPEDSGEGSSSEVSGDEITDDSGTGSAGDSGTNDSDGGSSSENGDGGSDSSGSAPAASDDNSGEKAGEPSPAPADSTAQPAEGE